ncbi:unnamed protein product [Amaranthus hypochondriacus]
MVEPAKARVLGRPRKNDAQKTASSATRTGGQVQELEYPKMAGEKASIPSTNTITGSNSLLEKVTMVVIGMVSALGDPR